jgi:hypothetical protein
MLDFQAASQNRPFVGVAYTDEPVKDQSRLQPSYPSPTTLARSLYELAIPSRDLCLTSLAQVST